MPSLNWIGKEKIITHHAEVPFRVLEHCYGFTSDNPESKSIAGSTISGQTLPMTTSNTSWSSRQRRSMAKSPSNNSFSNWMKCKLI